MNNPKISLTFYWPELMRQIHIAGAAEKSSDEMSDIYFNSRPVGSRLSAALSNQSSVIGSREELEADLKGLERKYSDGNVPRPENWGGFIVKPHRIEFWQGRLNRLHDRVCYTRDGDKWKIQRLSP
jgi:pyridoxamine 5'-phosphate oxidase